MLGDRDILTVRRSIAPDIEAVDRLDQPDRPDLLDVLERLAPPGVPARQRTHKRQMPLYELLARIRVSVLVVATKQLPILLTPPLAPHRTPARRLHPGPRSFSSRTTMRPSAASSTPNESTTVWRMRRSVSSPGGLSSCSASAIERSLSGPTRVRTR